MDKKTSKIRSERRGVKTLTKRDLTSIRKFLPKDWRSQIHQKQASVSLRQITEVFNQRSNNPTDNLLVWSVIKEVLTSAEQSELVEKVEKRISFCTKLYNGIQAK